MHRCDLSSRKVSEYDALLRTSFKRHDFMTHALNLIVAGIVIKCSIALQIGIYEPGHEKICLMLYANIKGIDQPAHPRRLISAIVVRCQDRMIPLVYYPKF